MSEHTVQLINTYMLQQLLDHSIPLSTDGRPVHAILLNAERVVEAQHQRQFVYQVDAKSFEAIVATQLGR